MRRLSAPGPAAAARPRACAHALLPPAARHVTPPPIGCAAPARQVRGQPGGRYWMDISSLPPPTNAHWSGRSPVSRQRHLTASPIGRTSPPPHPRTSLLSSRYWSCASFLPPLFLTPIGRAARLSPSASCDWPNAASPCNASRGWSKDCVPARRDVTRPTIGHNVTYDPWRLKLNRRGDVTRGLIGRAPAHGPPGA